MQFPGQSAPAHPVAPPAKGLIATVVVIVVLGTISPLNTAIGLIAVATVAYLATVIYRVLLFRSSMGVI